MKLTAKRIDGLPVGAADAARRCLVVEAWSALACADGRSSS
jgi:hypothetical protein